MITEHLEHLEHDPDFAQKSSSQTRHIFDWMALLISKIFVNGGKTTQKCCISKNSFSGAVYGMAASSELNWFEMRMEQP